MIFRWWLGLNIRRRECQADRLRGQHAARALALGTLVGDEADRGLALTLAGHLDEAQAGDGQNADLGAVIAHAMR